MLWEVETGVCRQTLTGHKALFSPDGRTVLTMAERPGDDSAKLWEAQTGVCRQTLAGHEEMLEKAVSFSPDGHTVLTASRDLTAKLWDAQTGVCRRTLTEYKAVVWTGVVVDDVGTVFTGPGAPDQIITAKMEALSLDEASKADAESGVPKVKLSLIHI